MRYSPTPLLKIPSSEKLLSASLLSQTQNKSFPTPPSPPSYLPPLPPNKPEIQSKLHVLPSPSAPLLPQTQNNSFPTPPYLPPLQSNKPQISNLPPPPPPPSLLDFSSLKPLTQVR